MFGLDSPRLLGSRPAGLAVTLLSNKFYLLYILPCVWKFFSNLRLDHDTTPLLFTLHLRKISDVRLTDKLRRYFIKIFQKI